MPAPEAFLTPRLSAEPLAGAHFSFLDSMHRDERVMATLGGVRTTETTRRYLRKNLSHWDRHGYGLWLFRDRESGAFAGRGGLRRIDLEVGTETELAYALMPDYWGRGLATEMAMAAVRIAFEDLSLADLVAFTLTTNRASQRVLGKVRFAYERNLIHGGLPHVLYRRRSEGEGG